MGILEGKCAIVTGAASGIGRATAVLLAREGAAVVAADVDGNGVDAVAAAIAGEGGRAVAAAGDLAEEAACRQLADTAVSRFGGLDVLVNCAGIVSRTSVVESAVEEWDRVIAVNLRAVFLLSKHSIPLMAARGGGAIVNIGSGWGLKGGPRAASYCASKGAVVNLTRAMAIDHGPQGIRVNCVCPGDTDTPLLRSEAQQLGEELAAFLVASAERPIQRLGTPEDTAQAVLFLASDASSWVTGTTLVVDGGGLA